MEELFGETLIRIKNYLIMMDIPLEIVSVLRLPTSVRESVLDDRPYERAFSLSSKEEPEQSYLRVIPYLSIPTLPSEKMITLRLKKLKRSFYIL